MRFYHSNDMHALLCAEAALGTKQKTLIYCLCTYFEWVCVDWRCIIVLQSWCFITVLGNKYFGTPFENMPGYSHTVCRGGWLDRSDCLGAGLQLFWSTYSEHLLHCHCTGLCVVVEIPGYSNNMLFLVLADVLQKHCEFKVLCILSK